MKKLLLPLLFALLLFPSLAQAKTSDRAVAQDALSAHGKSQKIFANAPISPAFKEDWTERVACVNDIFDGISESDMSGEEQFFDIFSLLSLANIDYYTVASRDKSSLVRKQSLRLKKISRKLKGQSASKRSRTIASSLRGHSLGMMAFLRLQGESLDFCLLKSKIEEAGGYTADNIDAATEEILPGTWLDGLTDTSPVTQSINRSAGLIRKGQRAMSAIRPRIKTRQITRYENLPSFYIGRNLDWRSFGKSFAQRAGIWDSVRAVQSLR